MMWRWFLCLGLLLASLCGWLWWQDHVARSLATVLLGLLWLSLGIVLWWLRRPGLRLSLRWLLLPFLLGLLALLPALLLRYEGSADGSAWPQLVWRWRGRDLPHWAAPTARPALPSAAVAIRAQWPRFMGPQGDGQLGPAEFALDWAAHPPRELWRQPMGEGWSGFAVAAGRAFTQEQRGAMECVSCYALENGQLLWLREVDRRFDEPLGGAGPRATPTLDVERGVLYAMGATGLLQCLRLADGQLVWQREVLKEAGSQGNLTWAMSGSPLHIGDLVLVGAGAGGHSLLAFDAASGALRWRAGQGGGNYASPMLMDLGGQRQVVQVEASSVAGFALADGRCLWRHDWPGSFPKVAQPLRVRDQQLLVSASYGMGCALLEMKTGQPKPEALWRGKFPRTKFSSAQWVGGVICGLDEGMLCAVSANDGERLWRQERLGFGQQLALQPDLLLVQAERGEVVLLRIAASGPTRLGEIKALSSKTWNPPALAGRFLLVRNDREAVAYELAAP